MFVFVCVFVYTLLRGELPVSSEGVAVSLFILICFCLFVYFSSLFVFLFTQCLKVSYRSHQRVWPESEHEADRSNWDTRK